MTRKQEIKAKIWELQNELVEINSKDFREKSLSVFEKCPKIESFGWLQFTPYFNDGDECYFGVRNDEFGQLIINAVQGWEWEDEKTFSDEEMDQMAEAIMEVLDKYDEDDYKEMFGDHVEIIVYPDRVEVNEYTEHY